MSLLVLLMAITVLSPLAKAAQRDTGQVKDLRFTIVTSKLEYQLGETVYVTLTLANIGNKKDITITYGSSKHFDFTVFNFSLEPIYKWSRDKYFLPLTFTITLHPGDSYGQTLDWPQTDFNGNQAGPGRFYISGETLFALEPHGRLIRLETETVSIWIIG